MASTDVSATGMTDGSAGSGIGTHARVITAFFDTHAAAQKATDDLVAAGIPHQQITMTEGAAQTGTSTTTEAKGFWEELKDLFIPDEDRHGYAEGLRRGGYLLAVNVDEANYNRVMDIMDSDGSVNMDEREASWRSEGWNGMQSADVTPALSTGYVAPVAEKVVPFAASSVGTKVDTLAAGADEVIPIYEETAQVGKRDVNHGRVRLRSYVVETPISEQVNLRHESVQVERHPVDRVVSATDVAFKDRVIEAEEHIEEAFIAKETRVKEEISLRKTVENQAQTMSDTVRRTEVDVEDERAGHAVTPTHAFVAASDSSLIAAHMDVISSDGTKVGTVDHLDGPDKIKLAKNTSPDGQHHYVPLSWVDHVDTHVHLKKPAVEVRAGW